MEPQCTHAKEYNGCEAFGKVPFEEWAHSVGSRIQVVARKRTISCFRRKKNVFHSDINLRAARNR